MEFKVIETGKVTQTALMVLSPGEESGPNKENEHAQSEQVLYLAEGTLEAEIADRTFTMKAGDSAIVGKGVGHRFVNRGSQPAVTFNVYSPPAY